MSTGSSYLCLGVALLATPLAAAQAPSAAPQPASPAAYLSAFDGYRSFAAEELADWRKANDTVRAIGGWRAYAREIQAGSREGGQPAPAAADPARSADPHKGHHR